ncbi:MAG: hypothetical protein RMJ28_07090 [Nitrososphaerota archaeon]|nr:hypothetical protein [Candidatus Calditenuaceae archaeon]MDW8073979.1 hypothetical protein [Nitrososphaerota archaeon]
MTPSGIVGEAYLLIVSIIVLAGFAAVYQSSYSSISEAVRLEALDARERVEKRLVIAAVFYNSGEGVLEVYVKSVGVRGVSLGEVQASSFYLFSQGRFEHFRYSDSGGAGTWRLELVSDSLGNGVLDRGDTLRAVLKPSSPLAEGTYSVRIVMPTGRVVEEAFSIGGG